MNLAQLTVVGNVVTDPDSRHLADGRCRSRFRIAATSRVLDSRTGRWRDGDTTYLAVVAWRGLGELAAGLRAGDRVVVIGHLRQYDYARDGAREIGYELQAQEIGVGLSARHARRPATGPRPGAGDAPVGAPASVDRSAANGRAAG